MVEIDLRNRIENDTLVKKRTHEKSPLLCRSGL